MNFDHIPVLLKQTIFSLLQKKLRKESESCFSYDYSREENVLTNGIFVDGTFGRGGHSKELLKFLDSNSKLFVFDKDPEAISFARKISTKDKRVEVIHNSFSNMKEEFSFRGIDCVDGIMLDLGVSSPQLEQDERGFSFLRDGPLDMRMDNTKGITVAEWLSKASIDEIREVIFNYGEERSAFRIAKEIINRREEKPFNTTKELAECISSIVPRKKGKHPATRSFQAFRIHINDELSELSKGLSSAIDIIKPGGILAVISFHSLEDRIVKKIINYDVSKKPLYLNIPFLEKDIPKPLMSQIARFFPDDYEILNNPRARSAVLRVAKKNM